MTLIQTSKKIFSSAYLFLLNSYISLISFFFKKKFSTRPPLKNINIISIEKKSGLGRAVDLLKIYFDRNAVNFSNIFLPEFMKNQLPANNKINLFVGNPDIILPAFKKLLGFEIFKSYNIGYWFWELEDIPSKWELSSSIIDEIWVCTEYNYKIFSKVSNNVKKIPFHISIDRKKLHSLNESPFNQKDKFIFFFNFDFMSHIERKNPIGLINAFLLAFEDDKAAHLYLKSINGDKKSSEKKKILKLIKDHENITLDDTYCSYNKVMSMINQSDCYVSLHRAEGLGFGMAEAMFLGKPVIATNYSGNLEFMSKNNSLLVKYKLIKLNKIDYIHSKNQYWADPDLEHAAFLMKRVSDDKDLKVKISLNAKKTLEKYSIEKMTSEIQKIIR